MCVCEYTFTDAIFSYARFITSISYNSEYKKSIRYELDTTTVLSKS